MVEGRLTIEMFSLLSSGTFVQNTPVLILLSREKESALDGILYCCVETLKTMVVLTKKSKSFN